MRGRDMTIQYLEGSINADNNNNNNNNNTENGSITRLTLEMGMANTTVNAVAYATSNESED